jgi:hypothetical protein
MKRFILVLPLLAACVPGEPAPGVAASRGSSAETGAALFAAHCAACHGADARGGGPAAAGLAPAPPDLTRIAARGGGTFPEEAVMSTIDGYGTAVSHDRAMPEFGALLAESPPVLWQDADGAMIPTPAALVALAAWLAGVQR